MLKPESNPDKTFYLQKRFVPSVRPFMGFNVQMVKLGLVIFLSCLFALSVADLGLAANSKKRNSLPDKKIKTPEFFGLFALHGKNTIELDKDSDPKNVDEQVEFVLYDQQVSSISKGWQVSELKYVGGKWRKSKRKWKCRVKPIKGKPSMLRLVPVTLLPPGVYEIGSSSATSVRGRIIVQQGQLVKNSLASARKALSAKQWDNAIMEADATLALDKTNANAKQIIIDVEQGIQDAKVARKRNKAQGYVEKAKSAMSQKQWNEAIMQAETALALDPENLEATQIMAKAERVKKDEIESEKELKEAEAMARAAAEKRKAMEREAKAKRKAANDEAQQKTLIAAHIAKGKTALSAKRWEEAVQEAKATLAIDSGNAEAKQLIADVRKGKKNERDAKIKAMIAAYKKNSVLIPAGKFMMGEGKYALKYEHPVRLNEFAMDKTEVTQAIFTVVMGGQNPSGHKNCPLCPVERVTWVDAKEFCEKVGKRLPTEAEWEYAARAGTTSKFYWGNGEGDNYAWYKKNSPRKTHPVGEKEPNDWGLFDMSGNVKEWVADWFRDYERGAAKNPQGPERGSQRVIRGGGYFDSLESLEHRRRHRAFPDQKGPALGFRCVQ